MTEHSDLQAGIDQILANQKVIAEALADIHYTVGSIKFPSSFSTDAQIELRNKLRVIAGIKIKK